MRNSLRGALLLALMLVAVNAAHAHTVVDPKIDAICRKFVNNPRGPGAAVAVLKSGKVVHLACYGLADVKKGEPITPTTDFDLASVSKQFTATCIMLLADRGLLKIDDPVRKYLPEFPAFNPKRPIRVVDLLNMDSGLPEYDDASQGWNRATMMKWLATEKLDKPTGTKYVYTNTNYVLLGYIVEAVSHKKMRDFLAASIFVPLGMTHTVFFSDAAHPPQRAMGYTVKKGKATVSRNDVPDTADGNVFSCLTDMIVWERALRRGALVSPQMLKLARTRGRYDNGKAFNYGFGWEISPSDASTSWISHSGAWYGASTYISLDFTDGESIIVLSNVEDLASTIADAIGER